MPIPKETKPKVTKKDKKADKVNMGREAWNKQEAARMKAAKDKQREEAEAARQTQMALVIKDAKSKVATKDKTCADLTDDDGPKLISSVVAKSLGLNEKGLPKEVLEAALKKMPEVDVGDALPKAALLMIAAAITEKKRAKAAKDAEKKKAREAEAKAKKAAKEAEQAAKAAAYAAKKEEELRLEKLERERRAIEAEQEGNDYSIGGSEPEPELQSKKSTKDEKKEAAKKAKAKKNEDQLFSADGQELEQDSLQVMLAKRRAVTGNLESKPWNSSVKIAKYTMAYAGPILISECNFELNQGCRYGLIGNNGAGKTNFLASIAMREVPIPDHLDMYHLTHECDPTDRTAIQQVIDHVEEEIKKLEALNDEIMEKHGPEDERLAAIGDRLDELDPKTFEARARKILSGIGFEEHVVPMDRKTKNMSGGWRMRVSLAKALFSSPTILLLDEPTNHLDLEACVWLEEYLKTYPKCLLCVSHSQDFMNTVCNRMLWLNNLQLKEYHGNYDMFVKLVDAEEKVQQRAWEKQCMDVEKLQDYIRKNSANKKTYKSAQSKQKVLDKLMLTAVQKPMIRKTTFTFEFLECHRLPSPVLPFDGVSFCYSGDLSTGQVLYRNLDLGVDCDSRIALVGPNGSGKSTLLKLMAGELQPTEGTVNRAQGLVLGKYHQHSEEVFDMTKTPLEFFPETYPNAKLAQMGVPSMSLETWRAYLGTFGITGRLQETQIGQLSDGQKSRLIFAMVRMGRPNVLLLDEPTNHLDVGAIDGLARVINNFNGGVVLVSHDFRLIDQVAKVIWECTGPNDGATIRVFPGTIHEYKAKLAKKMGVYL